MSSLSPTPQQPFAGLRVLECATVLAGPAVGAFFAELGAEVIKIEPPGGDVTRHWKLPSEDPESSVSAYFSAVNWGKQSVVLDLKSELDTFYELVKGADIVIANYKPGAAERLKVDYATLHALWGGYVWALLRQGRKKRNETLRNIVYMLFIKSYPY